MWRRNALQDIEVGGSRTIMTLGVFGTDLFLLPGNR
jgi:hypothetical protein